MGGWIDNDNLLTQANNLGIKIPKSPCCPSRCVLNQPLMMVIPAGGTTISCPEHGSHFIRGSEVCM